MAITTHILDTSVGRPAAGVEVRLERQQADGSWQLVGAGTTDGDGRLRTLVDAGGATSEGTYRLTFETAPYFRDSAIESFYPRVIVEFVLRDASAHYHVPLLVSPFGYSTYRGS